VDVLHREEVLARLAARVVDRDDVRVLQRRRELRLADEHLHELRILGLLAADPFEHDVRAARIDRERHLRHAAASQVLDQGISP
jgi:hypothetical protein